MIAPSYNPLEPKLEPTSLSRVRNFHAALADHDYCAPIRTDLGDHSYDTEPGRIYIELQLEANENIVVGTSEFRHPRNKKEGRSKTIRKSANNRKQKAAVQNKILPGPLCWKKRQQIKVKFNAAVHTKIRLVGSNVRKKRRPYKRKTNKLLLQCKVEVLDVRDTLYCHACGEWSLTANDLLCHTIMTHDVDDRASDEPFPTELYPETFTKQIQNLNILVNEQYEVENQISHNYASVTEIQNNKMLANEQFETENQISCPEKYNTEKRNSKKTVSEQFETQNRISCPEKPKIGKQNDDKSKTTIDSNEMLVFKEEYLDEDLYDNIFPCDNENMEILYAYNESHTETQKVNRVKTNLTCPNKNKKPDVPNKKLPRHLKAQKVNYNDNIIKNNNNMLVNEQFEAENQILCPEKSNKEKRNDDQSKNTNSIESNEILEFKEEYLDEDLYDNIFPCENENIEILYPYNESQTETQKVEKVKTNSTCPNKNKKPDVPNKKLPRHLKSQKVNYNDNIIKNNNNMLVNEQFEAENQILCPEKSNELGGNTAVCLDKEKRNYDKNNTTNSIESNEILEFKEEYLDEDLYDNIFQCENENIDILYPYNESQTENQKVNRVKTNSTYHNKNKKPEVPNEKLPRHLKTHKVNHNKVPKEKLPRHLKTQKVNHNEVPDEKLPRHLKTQKVNHNEVPNEKLPRHLKTQKVYHIDSKIKNKPAPRSIDRIISSDLKFDIENQNYYKIKKTKSEGPNILILPCKEEPQMEHQNSEETKSIKSKGSNKKNSQNQQGKTENKNYNNLIIKLERSKDKKLHKTNHSDPSTKRKQKIETKQHSANDMQLIPCKVEIPDVKDTLCCQECGEWSATADSLLFHTLMKHSIYDDQSDINNQEIETISSDYVESQKENQNNNIIESTKSKETKQKGKGEHKKRKSLFEKESNKVFPCDLCDKSFTRQCNLDKHKNAHDENPFSCEICGHMFDSEEKCVTHEKSHLGIKQFACEYCNKRFDTKNALEMHINSHTGAKPYTCDACEKSFSWKSNLRKHLEICSEYNKGNLPPKKYKCEKCSFKARLQSQLKRHCINVHGIVIFICDTCGRQCNTKAKMESHVLVHSMIKPFKCKLCDMTCVTQQKLKDHITACHLATKKFICKVCKKAFKTATCVKRHELIHSGIRPHTCQICNRSFVLKTTLSSHILTHSTEKPFSCVTCGSQFKTRFALKSHQEIHKEDRPIYVCAHCDDVVLFKSSFLRHLKSCLVLQGLPKKKIKRTSSKLTYCEKCNKTFTYNYYVTEHKDTHKVHSCVICNKKFRDKKRCEGHELKHAGLNPYGCDTCNKRFISKTELSDHMNKHMKIKPYTCDLCPQTFAYRSNMVAHKKMFHSKTEMIRTHECDLCHKKYFLKRHLIRHKQSHSKDRPFSCKKCGKKYPDKYQLKLHVRTHSNIKPYPCNICKKKSFKTKNALTEHIFSHEKCTVKLSCDICNRVFRDKKSLKSHMDKHKNIKIFSCDVCYKSFYNRQYLNRHKKSHGENFVFSCSECKVSFKEKYNLLKHLMSHSDKPYVCDVCEEPFRSRSLLQYHETIHDAVKQLYPCQYCSKAYDDRNSTRRHEKNSCPKARKSRSKLR